MKKLLLYLLLLLTTTSYSQTWEAHKAGADPNNYDTIFSLYDIADELTNKFNHYRDSIGLDTLNIDKEYTEDNEEFLENKLLFMLPYIYHYFSVCIEQDDEIMNTIYEFLIKEKKVRNIINVDGVGFIAVSYLQTRTKDYVLISTKTNKEKSILITLVE